MSVKEYLSQAIWLDQIINNKIEQLEALKSLASKVTTSYGQEKVDCTKIQSPMENIIVKIIDLENEVNEDIDRFVDLKREISNTISQVSNLNYRLLLEMRYINGKPWDEIANGMGYDRSSVFRIHGRALKKINKIKSCD